MYCSLLMFTTYSRSGLGLLLLLCSLLWSTVSQALPFNILPKAGVAFPSSVITGQTVMAYYTVQNATSTTRSRSYVKYLPPNTSVVTQGGTYPDTCAASFILASQGTCTLQLAVTGPVRNGGTPPHQILMVCFSGGTTCAGTATPLNVTAISNSVVSITIMAANSLLPPRIPVGAKIPFTALATYSNGTTKDVTSQVIWQTSAPDIATITSSGGEAHALALGTANISAQLGNVTSTSILLTVKETYAYITDSGSPAAVYSCAIDPNSNPPGALKPCLANINPTALAAPEFIAINPAGTYAYVTNGLGLTASTVAYCGIRNADGSLVNCATLNSLPITDVFSGIAINPAGTQAFITGITGGLVYSCSILTNGKFDHCTAFANNNNFMKPFGISVNAAGNYTYITNNNSNNVTSCAIDAAGNLNTCVNNIDSSFNFPLGITINSLGSYAYVTNQGFTSTLSACPINAANGNFQSACTSNILMAQGAPMQGSIEGISLNPLNNLAYIVTDTNSNIYSCPIAGATLQECGSVIGEQTSVSFDAPTDIALY
jgi:DNA-binding beta-propeller fold protein YncE